MGTTDVFPRTHTISGRALLYDYEGVAQRSPAGTARSRATAGERMLAHRASVGALESGIGVIRRMDHAER